MLIRGAKDAPKYKEFILPLIFTKRLCDVFDDELNRIAKEVGSRAKAFKLVKHDKKLVRFYLPLEPKNPGRSRLVRHPHALRQDRRAAHHPPARHRRRQSAAQRHHRPRRLQRHHARRSAIIDDDRLSNLIERISAKRLGLDDVEPDIIGRSYEYLIRKFAEGSGQSAGEFYTPREVGFLMARIMDPEPGMDSLRSCCGSAGLLIKCELVLQEKMNLRSRRRLRAAQALRSGKRRRDLGHGQHEHDHPRHGGRDRDRRHLPQSQIPQGNRLQTFDRVVANPMWNQTEFKEKDYDADELDRFPERRGLPRQQGRLGLGAAHPRQPE